MPQAVRRAAHDFRHAHRSSRIQWVLVRVALPARAAAAGAATARVPAVLVVGGGITTATLTIVHAAPRFCAGRSVATLADSPWTATLRYNHVSLSQWRGPAG